LLLLVLWVAVVNRFVMAFFSGRFDFSWGGFFFSSLFSPWWFGL
jgi:hypothetical protein